MTGSQVLAGTAAGVGGLMVIEQGIFLVRGLASRHWQSADGRVLDSQALKGLEDQMPGAAQWYLAGVRLAYEYHVHGERFVGGRSSWRGHWPSVSTAVRLARRYKTGQRVRVWYNPAAPSQAVLERGAGFANLVGVLIGLGVSWLGLKFLL
jgi:hypothetical protein